MGAEQRLLATPELRAWAKGPKLAQLRRILRGVLPFTPGTPGYSVDHVLAASIDVAALDGALALIDAARGALDGIRRRNASERKRMEAADALDALTEHLRQTLEPQLGRAVAAMQRWDPINAVPHAADTVILRANINTKVADGLPLASKSIRSEGSDAKLIEVVVGLLDTVSGGIWRVLRGQKALAAQALDVVRRTAVQSQWVGSFHVYYIGAPHPRFENDVRTVEKKLRRHLPTLLDRYAVPLVCDSRAVPRAPEPGQFVGQGGGYYVGVGASYVGDFIVLHPALLGPEVPRAIIHELGHHLWRAALNAGQMKAWIGLWGEREPLDWVRVAEVMANAYGKLKIPSNHVGWLPQVLQDVDRRLAVQINIATGSSTLGPAGERLIKAQQPAVVSPVRASVFSLANVRKWARSGVEVLVPSHVTTTYGATTPEEGFCEALSLYVDYGPRMLDAATTALLRDILEPHGLRRNPTAAPDRRRTL